MAMQVTKRHVSPNEIHLVLEGQLNFQVRKELGGALQEAQAEEMTSLLLNLEQVTFIDCAAVGLFLIAHENMAEVGKALLLVVSPGRVLDILQDMGVSKLIPITSPAS